MTRRRDSALYGNRPPGVRRQTWRAYGPMYPGGPLRARKRAEERESGSAPPVPDSWALLGLAVRLWLRVHPDLPPPMPPTVRLDIAEHEREA